MYPFLTFTKQINKFHFYNVVFTASLIYRIVSEVNPESIKYRAISSLSSLQAYSALKNPFMLQDGFLSGSDMLLTSLPIKMIYEFANWFKFDAIAAMQFHIILEILFQNYIIYIAIKSLINYKWTKIVSSLAFFNFFQIFTPINLANWGFIYGWNYGFTYSLAILAVVLTIRKKLGKLFLVSALLLATHFTVGIIVGSINTFLILRDYKSIIIRRKDIPFIITAIPILIFTLKIILESSNIVSRDFNEQFLNRIKLFQVHLFVDLIDSTSMNELAPIILHWLAMFCTLIIVVQRLKPKIEIMSGLESILHIIFCTSIIACFYSQLNGINSTLILMAFHRLSILIPYFFILLLPIFFNGTLRRNYTELFLMGTVLMIHIIGIGKITTVLSLIICLTSIYVYSKKLGDISIGQSILGKLIVISEIIFLFNICFWVTYQHLPRIIFLVLLLVSIFFYLSFDHILQHTMKMKNNLLVPYVTTLLIVLSVLGLLTKSKVNYELISQKSNVIDTYYQLAKWAKQNTSSSSVFFLPPDNDLFGWESFSERASVGKPMDWLHYSILYSRSPVQFIEGARKASLFGVDVQNFENQDKSITNITRGNILLNQIQMNYKNLSDEDLRIVTKNLTASYIVIENRKIDTRDFMLVYKVNNYRIYRFLNLS
jgi:hypothetical protein